MSRIIIRRSSAAGRRPRSPAFSGASPRTITWSSGHLHARARQRLAQRRRPRRPAGARRADSERAVDLPLAPAGDVAQAAEQQHAGHRSAARGRHVPRHGRRARRARCGSRGPWAWRRPPRGWPSTRSASSAAGADHRAQVGGVLLAQAGVQGAGAGQPHAVAGLAEIVAERGDEAQPAAGLGHLDVARRPAGGERQVGQRPEALQLARAASSSDRYWSVRSASTSPIGMVSIRVMSRPRPCAQRIRSGSSAALSSLQRHGVDLDLQAGRLGRLDPGQHLGEVAAAGQARGTGRASGCPARR